MNDARTRVIGDGGASSGKSSARAATERQTRLAILANGRSYHVQKWAAALVEQGLAVTLISFHAPPDPLDGVVIRSLEPAFSRLRGKVSLIDFRTCAAQLQRVLREAQTDVLLASYATSYGWMAAASGFHPTILQTWTYDVSVYPVSSWKRLILAPVVRRALRHADVITTDGEPLGEFIQNHYGIPPAEIVPLLWGIRVADFIADDDSRRHARESIGAGEDAAVILSHRGVLDWYRPDCVLDALLRYLSADDSAHALVLTLEHERSGNVQDRLDLLATHPRGHVFDRFLERSEMRRLWAAADVSISIPPHDGISVSALEGMAAGVVPVVSNIGSNRSLFDGDRARYVTDPATELFQALSEVVTNLPTWRDRVVEPNRRWVQRHGSVDQAARKLAAIVRNLAGIRETVDPSV